MRRTRTTIGLAAISIAALGLTACGGESEDSAGAAPAGEVGSTDLAAAGCPDTVVIQTDWNPEAEHGGIYQLLGEDPEIDAGAKSVSGTLVDSAGDSTGVNVEIRSGGPAIGFQAVSAQMYSDDAITLGYVDTDEAIQLSDTQPTVGVLAQLDISPQMIMWDPEAYPDVTSIADLGEAGATVRYFEGSAYMDYLTGAGILSEEQLDGSYDGTPAAFVAAGGEDAQQGYASAEPFIYEDEVDAWGKPVEYQLIHDAGFEVYASSLSARADQLEDLSGCFTELIPVMQQADLDYVADPATANELIVELVEQYDTGWQYSMEVAEYGVQTMAELELVGNGPDDTHGNFDTERLQTLIEQTTPIFTEQGTPPAEGLTPEDIATNEFIDTSIGS
ncbi:ABC transporter substrate-binding protein [Modestobacter sp. VKM Ac-2985]|uniref:ABC transporter substrate-binding protein n=1 Tax=Modestobacter sp. VKM Ac-2985 TaxID=3004139 RepID=UPI0022ABA971|nr:ABC transporter substrate-binding protein [Modestobacter sp. VKM Ac-2985]MCZ2839237.1 ABC transporter substrate-binding protein [Modestobacter sp. VKM Ac-2985]